MVATICENSLPSSSITWYLEAIISPSGMVMMAQDLNQLCSQVDITARDLRGFPASIVTRNRDVRSLAAELCLLVAISDVKFEKNEIEILKCQKLIDFYLGTVSVGLRRRLLECSLVLKNC